MKTRFVRIGPVLLGFLVVLSAAASVLATASPAYACSCVMFEDVIKSNDYAIAFVGEIIDEKRGPEDPFRAGQSTLLFDVQTMFKGDPIEQVAVNSPSDAGGGCGISTRETMIVLAYSDGRNLTTSSCSTAPATADYLPEIEALFGQGQEVLAPPVVTTLEPDDPISALPSFWPLLVSGFAILLAGGFALMARNTDR